MRRTDLSRPSFYVYFRDRHHLVLKVVERLQSESADEGRRLVLAEGSGREVIREATAGIVAVFERTAPCWRRWPTQRPTTRRLRPRIAASSTSSSRRRPATSKRRSRPATCCPCDPQETARALSIMNDRYMTSVLGRNPTVAPEVVVDTLTTIWTRTLYGTG